MAEEFETHSRAKGDPPRRRAHQFADESQQALHGQRGDAFLIDKARGGERRLYLFAAMAIDGWNCSSREQAHTSE